MRQKTNCLLLLLFSMQLMAVAQEHKSDVAPIKGKPIVQVFSNFNTGFGRQNDQRGFELERSYLGYQCQLNGHLSLKAVMDIGKPKGVDDYQRLAYIKNAMITWKHKNLTLNGGLISTTQFGVQEKFWGNRYVMKSFQDRYKFGHSADLGISAAYRFTDWLQADAMIVNGEGYKKVQYKDGLLYGLGITAEPVKHLTVRAYAGMNETSDKEMKNAYNEALFVGYKSHLFSLSAEYNMMQNTGFVKAHKLYGVSVYGAADIAKNTTAFVRYDNLSSNKDWNAAHDEQALLVGAQVKLGKYVKVAPNFRMSIPEKDGAKNKYAAFVNVYFGI